MTHWWLLWTRCSAKTSCSFPSPEQSPHIPAGSVALPQARVGIVLGGLISFAHTIGEFGVVLMIGGSISGETKVVSIAIYEQVEALNYDMAHLMSIILILMGMVMVALIASSVNKINLR